MRKVICLCVAMLLFATPVFASDADPSIVINDNEDTADIVINDDSSGSDIGSIMDSYTWNNLEITSPTPVTSYSESDTKLNIYPYYIDDRHISIQKVMLSGQQFWTTILNGHKTNCPYEVKDTYSYFTDVDGTTYAFITINNTTGYFVETVGLPSGYLIAVLDNTTINK